MEIIIKASQFILSLSILIVLHEMGHFIPAKLFKTRVEKFYLFFNPYFSLFKKKIGETEYGIGWLPLGGYVKISGMIDESMDKDQMDKPAEPWEFRAKPAWQRLIIMLGGVTVNIILAVLIYIGVMYTWGRTYIPIQNAVYGLHADSLMQRVGFEDGDIPVEVDGKAITPRYDYMDLTKDALFGRLSSVTVKRGNENVVVDVPVNYGELILASGDKASRQGIFNYRSPFVVDSILPEGTAAKSSLQKGDKIVAIDSVATPYYGDFYNEIQHKKGQEITLGVERGEKIIQVKLASNEAGLIGVSRVRDTEFFDVVKEDYTFIESIGEGYEETKTQLSDYVDQLPLLFSKAGISQLGGFGSMGGMFAPQWHWHSFWALTAMLSVILAFMNILPIPALDGGHAMFLIYELIVGKKPSDKFMEYAQMGGMGLLLLLMLFANGNDLFKLFN